MWIAVRDLSLGWIVQHTLTHEQYPVAFGQAELAANHTAAALNYGALELRIHNGIKPWQATAGS